MCPPRDLICYFVSSCVLRIHTPYPNGILRHGGTHLESKFKTKNQTNYVVTIISFENNFSMRNNMVSICEKCSVFICLTNQNQFA